MIIVSKQLNFVHGKKKTPQKTNEVGNFFAFWVVVFFVCFFNSNTLTAHRKQVDKGVSHCKNTLFSYFLSPHINVQMVSFHTKIFRESVCLLPGQYYPDDVIMTQSGLFSSSRVTQEALQLFSNAPPLCVWSRSVVCVTYGCHPGL